MRFNMKWTNDLINLLSLTAPSRTTRELARLFGSTEKAIAMSCYRFGIPYKYISSGQYHPPPQRVITYWREVKGWCPECCARLSKQYSDSVKERLGLAKIRKK